ncbi:HicB family protein [Pseudodesulfovibrio sp. JC047]|uniref:type II toxin-antitoxin system HicB family antitoxin n=1 Tax=Pseudodesulfovibrio sp. JC047 TaxID=2683199 RepID=UPI0013CF7887|nr:type II toxin-antitoxin system HicB family antitoxin [Pseudodesulfovibrio sp. JC047]NDV19030.1 HicB family protein [Pseudodesulfovibrio sp. JC047]
MQYVGLFEKDKQGYSVTFPDFPACTTCGETMDEAVDHAHEALAMFVEFLVEEGTTLPEPSDKKAIMAQAAHSSKKAINITVKGDGSDFEEFELVMHSHLLARIEKCCRKNNISPADFLAMAARKALDSAEFAG